MYEYCAAIEYCILDKISRKGQTKGVVNHILEGLFLMEFLEGLFLMEFLEGLFLLGFLEGLFRKGLLQGLF